MYLTLVTPEKKIFVDKEVEFVSVPGIKGEMTICSGHSPLVTTLDIGILEFKEINASDEPNKFAISWGYCEVAGNKVKVLAETAENKDMIDFKRVEKSLKDSNDALDAEEIEPEEISKYLNKIKKAETRQELSKSKK